jgi:protein SCO1/2
MNQRAFLTVLVAIMIPVLCYLVVKYASERTVVMPRKYHVDDIIEGVEDGKRFSDTIWHRTANFRLINQLGDSVELYDIQNKIIIADFFFSRCLGPCPKMTANMKKLQASFAQQKEGPKKVDSSVVHFLSFTVDPAYDSVPVLKAYADRFSANHDNWWFVTGPKQNIYDFALNELKLGVEDRGGGSVDTSFIHSSKFVLIDRNFLVRGYYDGTDSISLSRLAKDVGLLMLEKDKKKPSTLFQKIISLSWLWLIIVFMIIAFILYLRRRRKITEAKS